MIRALIIGLMVLILGACSASQPKHTPTPVSEPIPRPEPALEIPEVPTHPPAQTSDVLGQTAHWVAERFGAPDLLRWEGKLQAFLFQTQSCVLDLTLQEADPTDYFRVVHISARTKSGKKLDSNMCLSLYDLKKGQPLSPDDP